MAKLSAVEQIEKLRAQFETEALKLRSEALSELNEELSKARGEVFRIEKEIEALTGKPARKARGSAAPKGAGKRPDLQELKALLSKAEGKTINLRREGYDTANVKTLAAANPGLLKLGGKNPWPTVTLLK